MTDREQVLSRIRAALGETEAAPLPPLLSSTTPPSAPWPRFLARAAAAGVVLHHADPDAVLAGFAGDVRAGAIPPGQRVPAGIVEPPLAVNLARYLIAETGTAVEIVRPGDPRDAAALARVHLIDAREAELVADLDAFYAAYRPALGAGPELALMVTGPSRTADIEQTLVLGAHGPVEVHLCLGDRVPAASRRT